jgi:hypothetical protein
MSLGRDAEQEERRFWLRLMRFSGLPLEELQKFVSLHDSALSSGVIHKDVTSPRLCPICVFRHPQMWQE